jgi:hypothetical protein
MQFPGERQLIGGRSEKKSCISHRNDISRFWPPLRRQRAHPILWKPMKSV